VSLARLAANPVIQWYVRLVQLRYILFVEMVQLIAFGLFQHPFALIYSVDIVFFIFCAIKLMTMMMMMMMMMMMIACVFTVQAVVSVRNTRRATTKTNIL